MEHVNRFHLLAGTYELDWLSDNGADRECCTTTCVAVELGENHAVEVETVVKLLGCVDSVLTGHRVDNEESLVRVDGVLQSLNLVHHLLVYCQTTCGIDDYYVVAFCLCLANSVVCDAYNVLVLRFRIYGYAYLLANNLELFDSCRTIYVAGYEQRVLVLFVLEHISKLARESGFTRALQTAHEDD